MICLWRPALSPPNNAKEPSSPAMVFMVPKSPLYLNFCPGSGAFYICNLTLAVSIWIVATSATHAEKEAIPTFLKKNPRSDSPCLLTDCIFKDKIIELN